MNFQRERRGYTLLEVLVALSISTLLMAALYYALRSHVALAGAGRNAISGSALTRSILVRLSNDIKGSLTFIDPNRYKKLAEAADAAESAATSGSGGASTPMSGSTAPMSGSTTPKTGSTGTGSSGSSSSSESDSTSTAGSQAVSANLAAFPLGVKGDSTSMHLFVSKVPIEAFARRDKPAELTSDLRRISYWLGNGGLHRLEAKLITSEQASDLSLPGDVEQFLIAPEVRVIEFQYFDGTSWLDTWDSTELTDEVDFIPVGPPRAISIRIGVQLPGGKEGDLKFVRHVVAIPTANGNQEIDQEATP